MVFLIEYLTLHFRINENFVCFQIETAKFNDDGIVREFGISIGERGNATQFLKVPAASLLTPKVVYNDVSMSNQYSVLTDL